ncbi:MAG: hypothetical protein B7X04_00090 [Parcubacteria group bacterium 21-54-25]|nr:MAG: hypothetical protein B7X04_00090 [Parcubacteria group bacterium 21-54-25]HQU07542.1 hypothetical protein [Candidatus Paceibacterota bacterium]
MHTLSSIGEFLSRSLSQKEVSLVIIPSEDSMSDALQALESNGFSPFKKFGDLERGGKHYFIVDASNAKTAYDLAREYGTGQITHFNSATGTPAWTTPTYKDSAFVLVIVKSDLVSAESAGLDLLSASGLASQFA